jgi:hypothetical protein
MLRSLAAWVLVISFAVYCQWKGLIPLEYETEISNERLTVTTPDGG